MEKIKYKTPGEIPLNKIYISKFNVRTEEQYEGMEELVNSINKFNLISPVIVIDQGGKFELIVGQRRFLAFKRLKKDKIPAIVIGKISDESKRIISFAENIHRRDLNFHDTVSVCEVLFEKYPGNEKEKISQIAKDIGIGIKTVSEYLGYKLIPQEVQDLVKEGGGINKTQASKITTAFWPNTKKIIALARKMRGRTRSEWRRALNYSKKKADASVNEIIEVAESPETTKRITIEIDKDHLNQLHRVAKARSKLLHRDVDTSELISEAVSEFLKRAGMK